jgi:hypothetical protein
VRSARSASAMRLCSASSPEASSRIPESPPLPGGAPASTSCAQAWSVRMRSSATDRGLATCCGRLAQPAMPGVLPAGKGIALMRIAGSYQAHLPAMQNMRHVRSFVLRAGRVTAGQERALKELWPRYGLPISPRSIWILTSYSAAALRAAWRSASAPAKSSVRWRRRTRDVDYIGIEVHRPGVGQLLLRAEKAALSNLRVICHDAVEVLAHTDRTRRPCDEILVFFPDPWHKKRHHKRRLIEAKFVHRLGESAAPRRRAAAGYRLAGLRGADARCVRCRNPADAAVSRWGIRATARLPAGDALRAARGPARPWRLGSGLPSQRRSMRRMLYVAARHIFPLRPLVVGS